MKDKRVLIGAGVLLGAFLLTRRKAPGVGMPNIINITDLLQKGAGTYSTRNLSQINKIVLHHSAGTFQHDAYDMARWHTDPQVWITNAQGDQENIGGRGWPGIGYHFVIQPDGTTHQTNNLDTISYHTQNNNTVGIGICMTGNFDTQQPTPEAMDSLKKLVHYLRVTLDKDLPVKQHRNYANKSCPGQNLYSFPEHGLASIGKIYKSAAELLTPCRDGTFSDKIGHGTCKGHGGVINPLDSVTEADLETYFYKDYYIAEYLTKAKIDTQSWRRYGDSNLSKEKFMFLKDGGDKIDLIAQELTWQIGIEVTPQDIVEVILATDNPYTYIEELKWQVKEIQDEEAKRYAGIGAILTKTQKELLQVQNAIPCNDGTFSTNRTYEKESSSHKSQRVASQGTCKGHGGIKRTFRPGNKRAAALKAEEQDIRNEINQEWQKYYSKTLMLVPGFEYMVTAEEKLKFKKKKKIKELFDRLEENWREQATLYKWNW